MASNSETGHAKNVANFEDMISFCTGYGATYNPSKASIKLPALNTKRTDAVNALAAVNAGIILVNSNPKGITSLVLFGTSTYKEIVQNLVHATGYNVIALPLAA